MSLRLVHPGTGAVRFVDTGWSWSIFFGAAFLGLPLFARGLALWGTVMVVVWCTALAVPLLPFGDGGEGADWIVALLGAGLSVYLGWRGNAMSAAHYLACGYEIDEPGRRRARRFDDI
jgi:hypothetical protein